jgi:cytochrome c
LVVPIFGGIVRRTRAPPCRRKAHSALHNACMPVVVPDRAGVRIASLALALLAAGCEPAGPASVHAPSTAAQRERGQRLIAQYQCGSCHFIPDVPAARGAVGPPLVAFGRRSYIAGEIPNGADALARWIAAPAALVPDTTMPAMGVTPQDARDMAAYLLALE